MKWKDTPDQRVPAAPRRRLDQGTAPRRGEPPPGGALSSDPTLRRGRPHQPTCFRGQGCPLPRAVITHSERPALSRCQKKAPVARGRFPGRRDWRKALRSVRALCSPPAPPRTQGGRGLGAGSYSATRRTPWRAEDPVAVPAGDPAQAPAPPASPPSGDARAPRPCGISPSPALSAERVSRATPRELGRREVRGRAEKVCNKQALESKLQIGPVAKGPRLVPER